MTQAAAGGIGLRARTQVSHGQGEGGDLGGRQRAGVGLHDSCHTLMIRLDTDIFSNFLSGKACIADRKPRSERWGQRDSCDRSREAPVEAEVVSAAYACSAALTVRRRSTGR
ncbi:hypothetical protein GCM10017559_34210 [Streptosporangium longisporum]|uniref:Uncharacterized protein n=1 Tax=Streptosporangium longisporum TaxID=46187 RepID=A0ABP6KG17_9ACTN